MRSGHLVPAKTGMPEPNSRWPGEGGASPALGPETVGALRLRRTGRRLCGFSPRTVKRTWCIQNVPSLSGGSRSGPPACPGGDVADCATRAPGAGLSPLSLHPISAHRGKHCSGFLSCLRSAPVKQLSMCVTGVTNKQAKPLSGTSLGNV